MSAKEVRLRHAKRLARFARNSTSRDSRVALHLGSKLRHSSLPGCQRSARLVAGRDAAVYSVKLERCRSLAIAFKTAVPRIEKACSTWCDVKRADEAALLNAAIAEIELCLGQSFGGGNCGIYVGLLNPGAKTLTYVATSSHSPVKEQRLKADAGVLSRCITKGETVTVENIEISKESDLKLFGSPDGNYPFICTPLRAETGRPLGILAVDGFCSNAMPLDAMTAPQSISSGMRTSAADFHIRLAPFLAKNDDACKRIKFWKLQNDNKNENVYENSINRVAACVICGHVYNVDRSKGVGMVYSIRWEDGKCETEISFRALKERLRATPTGLGVGVPCDTALQGFLEYAGKIIGDRLFR